MRHVTVSVTSNVTDSVTVTGLFVCSLLAFGLDLVVRRIAPACSGTDEMSHDRDPYRWPFRFTAGYFSEDAFVEREEAVSQPELVKEVAIRAHFGKRHIAIGGRFPPPINPKPRSVQREAPRKGCRDWVLGSPMF